MSHAIRACCVLGLGILVTSASATAQDAEVGGVAAAACPSVTIVTVPSAVVRFAGGAPQYVPGSFELCAGQHPVVVSFADGDTLRLVLDIAPGLRHVRIDRPGTAAPDVQAESDRLARAARLYVEEGNALAAAVAIEGALLRETLSHRDSVAAFMYLNLAKSALGDMDGARAAMNAAHSLEPCLAPATMYLTPIWNGEWQRTRDDSCDHTTAVVVLTSAILPGAGQLRVGEHRDAAIQFGRTVIPAVAGAMLLLQATDPYDAYLRARTPAVASAAYDQVSWRVWTGGALLLAAGVFHVLNLRDAIQVGRRHQAEVAPWVDFGGDPGQTAVGFRISVGAN